MVQQLLPTPVNGLARVTEKAERIGVNNMYTEGKKILRVIGLYFIDTEVLQLNKNQYGNEIE